MTDYDRMYDTGRSGWPGETWLVRPKRAPHKNLRPAAHRAETDGASDPRADGKVSGTSEKDSCAVSPSIAICARRHAAPANAEGSTTKITTWRPRAAVRRLKRSPAGVPAFGFGVRVGYWPCLLAPYVQLTLLAWHVDLWCGFASYKGGAR